MNIEKFLRTNFLKEHLRTAASEASFYLKKEIIISFITKFKQSERKISMSVFTVLFSLAEVINSFLVS